MTDKNEERLSDFYQYVQDSGKLRTVTHAKRWTVGVLKTLGTSLDRKTRKEVSKALPKELSNSLTGVFWLLHFPDPNMPTEEFCRRVARRSGNSDSEFALYPTTAVFAGLKLFLDDDLQKRVPKSLSPEISQLWEHAQPNSSPS